MDTKSKTRDGLYLQLEELQAQLYGISPKLALHAYLSSQITKIKAELGGQSSGRKQKNGAKVTTSLTGTRIVVYEGKRKDHHSASLTCSHIVIPGECRATGCTRSNTSKGTCTGCGKPRYRNYCRKHGPDDVKHE